MGVRDLFVVICEVNKGKKLTVTFCIRASDSDFPSLASLGSRTLCEIRMEALRSSSVISGLGLKVTAFGLGPEAWFPMRLGLA